MPDTPCIQCGQAIEAGDRFCMHCGAVQTPAASVTPPSPPAPASPPLTPPTPVAPVQSSSGGCGVVVLILLVLAALAGGGAWLFQEWKQRVLPQAPANPGSRPGLPVPYGHDGATTPPLEGTVAPTLEGTLTPLSPPPPSPPPEQPSVSVMREAAAVTNVIVTPWMQSPEGVLGIGVTAAPVGIPANADTMFNGWLKDSDGAALATLDRSRRSPDGGLGFMTTAADGNLSAFIPARSIGLPTGEHALRVEVQASNGSALSPKGVVDFKYLKMGCHPDRIRVGHHTDSSGRQMLDLRFDITATPLTGRMGAFLLHFKRADTQQFIPCSDPQYSGNGLLSVGYRFQMPAHDTILDDIPIVIPLDFFPDAECLLNIEFYDSANRKLNWLNDLRFHPRKSITN